jgi:hypothetical protein
MEKLIIGTALIFLNVGLYLIFVLRRQLNLSVTSIRLFYLLFALVLTVSWINNGASFELLRSSIYLLLAHLIVMLSFKFLVPAFFQNHTAQKILNGFFNYVLLSVATLATTVWQVFSLLSAS